MNENEGEDTDAADKEDGTSGTTTKEPESGIEKATDEAEKVVSGLATKGFEVPKEKLTTDVKAETTGVTSTWEKNGVCVCVFSACLFVPPRASRVGHCMFIHIIIVLWNLCIIINAGST